MKTNYLFPNCFKIYGWIILIPSLIVGALSLVFELEPTALEFEMPALFVDEFMGQNKLAPMMVILSIKFCALVIITKKNTL